MVAGMSSAGSKGTVGWLIEQLRKLDPDCYVYLSSESHGTVKRDFRSPRVDELEHCHFPGTVTDLDTPAEGPDEGYVELVFREP